MSHYQRFNQRDPRRWVARWAYARGARGTFIAAIALVSLWLGYNTAAGYAGRPEDAPHLRLPSEMRAGAWIAFSVMAFWLARRPCPQRHRYAIALLAIMPNVRLASYFWSWAMSWGWLDRLTPSAHPLLQGSPGAINGVTVWVMFDLLLLAAAWTPVTWRSLHRDREGRL